MTSAVTPWAVKIPEDPGLRWGRPMELWQIDVVGGVHLSDGTEAKVVTGIDDNSRFVVPAKGHGAFATPHGRPRKPRQDAPDRAGVKGTPLRGRPQGRALTPAS